VPWRGLKVDVGFMRYYRDPGNRNDTLAEGASPAELNVNGLAPVALTDMNNSGNIRTCVLLLSWCFAASVLGQAQPFPALPAPPPLGPLNDDEFRLPLNEEEAANVDRLIGLLGSPQYKEREEATNALIEIGAPAFARLRTTYEQTDELEIRLRVEQVVRTAYLNRYVFDQNGFLGIGLAPYEPRDGRGPRRVELETGVLVKQVIPNTGAAKAGLREEDVIIALNEVPIKGTGREITDRFSDLIRQNAPGAKVRLTVVRGMETLTLDATIGRCPENNVRSVQRIVPLFDQINSRFDTWWFKYFRGAAKSVDEP